MDNYEVSLISTLLQNPKMVQQLDLDPDWFFYSTTKEIAKALMMKQGTEDLLGDILITVKQINPLSELTYDVLSSIKQEEPTSTMAPMYAKQVHKAYIISELKRLTKEYSLSTDERFLEPINEYQKELDSLKIQKGNGKIDVGYTEFIKRLKAESEPFIKTLPTLDVSLGGGFGEGELIIIGARPSVGKTAFAINIALEALNRNEGLAIDFFTLEMTLQQMMNRFISKRAKINSMFLRNPKKLDATKKNLAAQTYKEIATMDLRIYDQEYNSLNDILFAIRKRAESGKYLAIIDYAGLVKVKDSNKNERQVLNEVTRELKLLTNELGITIVLLSQLNRESAKGNKKPTLADLKESGSLEQDANVVVLLYRPDEENKPQLVKANIAKARDGIIGELNFKFLGQFMDFSRWDDYEL